jgi:site-specific recombinase XerD
MPTRSNDPQALQEFVASIGARDPKTVTTYLTTVRDFVPWLVIQPGGTPFHLGLVTETAVRGYMDFLATTNPAPRTRRKALSALRCFCQWAVDEGHLRRNSARAMERPTVVDVAPTELSDKQRFVLKTMVEQHATPRFAAIFALGLGICTQNACS